MGIVASVHAVVGMAHRPEQHLHLIIEPGLDHFREEGEVGVVLVLAEVVVNQDQHPRVPGDRVQVVFQARWKGFK